ncbi:MAG: hypothetical protein KDC35_05570 [Acidobacteria bacterium]|nr:hypothetical protein [Acidobacteriota bacterium]
MTILAIFKGRMTKEQYDSLRQTVNWEHNQPEGGTFHAASFDSEGNIHVADVWGSERTMNDFVENRLIPALANLNIDPPTVSTYPIHKIDAYSSIEKYKI